MAICWPENMKTNNSRLLKFIREIDSTTPSIRNVFKSFGMHETLTFMWRLCLDKNGLRYSIVRKICHYSRSLIIQKLSLFLFSTTVFFAFDISPLIPKICKSEFLVIELARNICSWMNMPGLIRQIDSILPYQNMVNYAGLFSWRSTKIWGPYCRLWQNFTIGGSSEIWVIFQKFELKLLKIGKIGKIQKNAKLFGKFFILHALSGKAEIIIFIYRVYICKWWLQEFYRKTIY